MPIISPKIPSGLEELMRGLAKSCIKENPDNIYLYAAEYFENLLKERDGAVDQNYKKFATYKVYKKNKSARLKRGKQNSNDVNALPSVNGFKRDENDVSGERKDSIEEIVLSETSKPQQAVVKSQSSIISSESEITTEVKKEASVDIEGVPSQSQEDDEVQNMVLDDDMAHAALKIQSSFRGHKVRREMRDAKLECEDEKVIDEQSTSEAPSGDDFPSEGEKQHENEIKESEAEINVVSENEIVKNDAEAEIDTIETTETESLVIDDDIENMVLNEEMEEAALKIQASFRGARVRREIKPLVDNDVEDVEEAEQTEEMQQDGEVESEQTKEIQQGDEIEFEQTCDEEKVSDVETIVEESEKAHVENIEEIATIIMEEEIENQGAKKDTENPQETFEPQIEETIPQDDIVNIDDAPETENIVECVNDDVTYSEEPLETEKNVDASENFDDTSVKEENLQVDTEDAKEQEKVNDINDEAITEDEDINKAEALSADAIQFTEVVDDSLIEPTPSVDAIEADKSTIGDCEKINKTFEASEEKEEIVETENGIIDEEKQVSDETKFVRPPTIENELLSIENDDDLLPEVLNETQAETIKGSLDNEEKLETEQSEIDEIIIDESLSECIKDEEKAIEGEKVVEEEETIEKLNEIIEEKLVETEKNLNELDESSIKNQKVSLEEFENLIGNEENFADNKENLIGNNEGSIENVDISVEAKENSIEKVEKSGNIEENCEQHVETEETFIEKENLNEGEEKLIKSSENSVEGEEVIELTDNLKTSVGEENVNENENYEKQPQKASDLMEEGRNVEVNEQEPQKESSVLPKESETESFEKNVVLPSDEIDGGKSPVVEEICTKKSIGMLEPDQENLESEIVEFPLNKELSVDPNVNGNESDLQDDIKTLPSGEIEYASLKESFSEHDGSIDEVDNKSGDLTDEKSIDNDTTGSRQNSMEDKLNEIQEDVNELLAADEQEIVSAANDIEQNETSQNLIEPILHTEISPMELMDEIVNECAGAVANEIIFTSQVEPVESNLTKSVESENAEKAEGEIVEPKLMEKNPFEEIAAKSIDLSQEILHRSEDEMEPIRDEILKPEGEESEIPEESQAPVDKNIPVVAMEEKSPSIETDEQMPQEENRGDEKVEEKSPQEDDDDVLDMVLDEEMEDAALKIQAAFRGHKVRKEKLSCAETEQESSQQDEEESQKVDVNVVIDQCSEDNVESQENEETEQQDTSADCEEIQESEAGDQEETQEEPHEEEQAEEEETAVESETNEQGGDDPEGTPADGESTEQQNDDDDVANMVLDEEMEQAALKIQSTFRGHKTRQDMKKDETEAATSDEQEEQKETPDDLDDDIKNMVLDDEMEQAALKIQCTFRGHKTRKDMKKDETAGDEEETESKEGEEQKEEEPAKEEPAKKEEAAQSTSSEKSAQQLQEEEDIASIVMDEEMERTALKIQSAFRGKKGFGKKAPKDGDESTASSALDQQSENELPDDESPVKSEDDPFQQGEESSHEVLGEKSYDDEKDSDYSAAQYSSTEGNNYSVERYNTSYEYEHEPLDTNKTIDDINLMQGGGIFPEPSAESFQDILTGSSGEERNPDRNLSYEKVPSDKSYEIDDSITSQHESKDEKVIENFDFTANKDTAEAMYYSLKKNEIETQKQHSMEKQLTAASNPKEDYEEQAISRENSYESQSEEDEDDDDVVVGMRDPPPSAKRLKYGMSMDDRLLGSILSQDYSAKERKEGYPDDGFDPMLEAAMRNHHFLEKLHEISNSEEDQFDDFYNSNNIRQKIMASSISIADSDYFDPTTNKSIIDDDKIRTALETIHSTDSESTIGSAATKIPLVGGVGRRINNITTHSMQYSSIGNAAIDRSLDEFIQSQELRIDRFDEEMEGYCSPPPRKQESEEWTDDPTTYTDSDKKLPSSGIIGIKMEQKSFLTVDERRRTLHREDAIQRNSTREDEASSNSSTASGEKLSDKNNSVVETATSTIATQDSVIDTVVTVPVIDLTEKSNLPCQLVKPRMKRQHTMPVQIQTDVIRILPKHLRKRIKSADGEKKKKFSK